MQLRDLDHVLQRSIRGTRIQSGHSFRAPPTAVADCFARRNLTALDAADPATQGSTPIATIFMQGKIWWRDGLQHAGLNYNQSSFVNKRKLLSVPVARNLLEALEEPWVIPTIQSIKNTGVEWSINIQFGPARRWLRTSIWSRWDPSSLWSGWHSFTLINILLIASGNFLELETKASGNFLELWTWCSRAS
jgi:hypothetical protein